MKRYVWLIVATVGLLVCVLTHVYELLFGQLGFWIYLILMGVSLALMLIGVILGLIRVFSKKHSTNLQP